MNKRLIFLLDDEPAITDILKRGIEKSFEDVEVITFNTCKEFDDHPDLEKVALFIYDIGLQDHLSGDQIACKIHKINPAPVLFISGVKHDFSKFDTSVITYDFIAKPFNLDLITNRIKLLLKVSKTYECFQSEQNLLKLSLKEVFDHSNLYLLILDNNMIVNSCSYKLMQDMGYDDICDIEGKNWTSFIPMKEKQTVTGLHDTLVGDIENNKRKLQEAVTTVQRKDGSIFTVKWFYSLLINGHVHSFNIGIPFADPIRTSDSIEMIRDYWRQSIIENNATLKAIKSTLVRR